MAPATRKRPGTVAEPSTERSDVDNDSPSYPMPDMTLWTVWYPEEAEAPKPPPRWIDLGPPDSPHPLAAIPNRAWYEWHWVRGIDPDKKRVKLPHRLREAVLERDGHNCGICGESVAADDIHIDHIYPVSRGGEHELDNLQVAHSLCNMRKGAKV